MLKNKNLIINTFKKIKLGYKQITTNEFQLEHGIINSKLKSILKIISYLPFNLAKLSILLGKIQYNFKYFLLKNVY